MTNKLFEKIIIFIIILISIVRICYSIPYAPTLDTDAIFSVEAAKSIIQTGVPIRISTNELYDRDYLFHYLLAGSIFVFGDNNFGYAIINIIFGALILFLTYAISNSLTKNKLLIFFIIIFLGLSSLENSYVINPRSYIQFQFFFILSVVYFYKGFVSNKKNKKNKIIATVSYIASVLSHYGGLILLPIFGLYIIVRNKKWYKDKHSILFFLVCGLASVIITIINPSKIIGSMLNYKNNPSDDPIELSFHLFTYLGSIFTTYLPFISIFILLGLIYAIKNKNKKVIYYQYIFWSSIIVISSITAQAQIKYVLCLLPLIIILSFIGIKDFVNHLIKLSDLENNKKIEIIILILIIISSLFFIQYGKYSTYGFNSHFPDNKKTIAYILNKKQSNDIIICTDPTVYLYYVNQCDYFLKQQKNIKSQSWEPLNQDYKDKNNLVFLDNLNNLQNIFNNNQRIWIIINKRQFDPIIEEYIKNNAILKNNEINDIYSDTDIFLKQ